MTEDVLTEEAFARNVGTKFRVSSDDGRAVELELAEVVGYASNPGDQSGLERFSAYFEGAADAAVSQGTFTFEHERLGSFLLFITPIARNERGLRYEAVVNRRRGE